MPSIKSAFLALLLLVPLVQSSPVVPTASPAHAPWRIRNEPDSLLGRRYVVQNHPSAAVAQDTPAPPHPRSYAPHQVSSTRSARFAKYIAERAATNERIQTSGGTIVNDYVSDVGPAPGGVQVTKAGNAEVEEMPTSYRPYNTAVTLVARPSGTAKATIDKTKSKSATTKHGQAA
ncbi:hypothetical protein DAEQUDRAFT_761527 [Daedalea quercina L-15889]|uniref:Uncharacterized protein n=1 Tax=Daedalea quercina L-15889 TaxID=1314783 RepID=A0A165TWY3_9APHY|nr:hypothetical protein DAEQUDRAFT_761527 [Daedalea quercina L-15889]